LLPFIKKDLVLVSKYLLCKRMVHLLPHLEISENFCILYRIVILIVTTTTKQHHWLKKGVREEWFLVWVMTVGLLIAGQLQSLVDSSVVTSTETLNVLIISVLSKAFQFWRLQDQIAKKFLKEVWWVILRRKWKQ
jgi:hypothetical protein